MSKLKLLVIHCTATPEGRVVTASDIMKWHTQPISAGGRGWDRPGYSDMIYLGGQVCNLRKYNDDELIENWEMSYGATGINSISRHIVYVGGCDKDMKPKDTRTKEQLEAMRVYVLEFLMKHPDVMVCGHNQWAAKACPSFDVPKWASSIGVMEHNIYRSGKPLK